MGNAARLSREQARNHAKYWGSQQEGAFKYVALGDSVGVGVGVDDPPRSYVAVIAARLEAARDESVSVENLSVSGARAREVLENQIPKLADLTAPNFVTCVVGGNDVAWRGRFRAAEFERDMEAIVTTLPAGAVLGSVPSFLHWPNEGRARKANQVIHSAARRHGHNFADIHAVTAVLPIRSYMGLLASDFFHPNEGGHELWADAIWKHRTTRYFQGDEREIRHGCNRAMEAGSGAGQTWIISRRQRTRARCHRLDLV